MNNDNEEDEWFLVRVHGERARRLRQEREKLDQIANLWGGTTWMVGFFGGIVILFILFSLSFDHNITDWLLQGSIVIGIVALFCLCAWRLWLSVKALGDLDDKL